MTKSQIKALVNKNLSTENLAKTKNILQKNYDISYGKYEPEEIRQSLLKGSPVIIQDHVIIGMDEAKNNTFQDTEGEIFKIDIPVNAIIVNDTDGKVDNKVEDSTVEDHFAIMGINEWKTPINEFDNIIAPLSNGKPFLPATPVIFNFINPTESTRKLNVVSKTVGVQIYLYDRNGYVDNAFHEIGHIFWRTRLTYDEQESFQELFDGGKLSNAIYEYEWEKKSAEEIFCTVYKWYLKSILVNPSFRKILSFEEPDGYEIMTTIIQRIGLEIVKSGIWENLKDQVENYLNPKFDTRTNTFFRKRGDFEAIEGVEVPDDLLKNIALVQDGITFVSLFKGKRAVPVNGSIIDYDYAASQFTQKMEKSRSILPAGKQIVFMDMDGVVADIDSAYKSFSGRDIYKDDHFTVRQTIGSIPHFWRKLPVLLKGQELYNMLKNDYAIIFLTTPIDSVLDCKADKIAWAKQYFPEVKTILFSNRKEEFAASNQSVLIDDFDKNIKAFNESGGNAIHSKTKNNDIVTQIKEIFDPKDEIAEIKEQLKSMQVETSPSEAQKKTGNYKKGKILFKGLSLIIENPKGSIRFGRGSDGKKWMNVMKAHYGYIDTKPGEEGSDGDKIDFFLGENLSTNKVFVINQVCPETGMFDEIKLVMGCNTKEEAGKLYRSCYSKNWNGFNSIVQTNIKGIREYIKNGYRYEPFGDNFIEQEPMQKATFLEMLKARTTKYIRRESDGKGGWKYFYKNDIKKEQKKGEEEKIKLRMKFDSNDLFFNYNLIGFQERVGNKPTSQKALSKTETIELKMDSFDEEHTSVIDENGNLLFSKVGVYDEIYLDDVEINKSINAEIITHTHPEDVSFSAEDVFLALSLGVKEIRVQTPKDTYIFRINHKSISTGEYELKNKNNLFMTVMSNLNNEIFGKMLTKIKNKEINRQDAEKEHRELLWNEIMRSPLLAEYFNIEYKKVLK